MKVPSKLGFVVYTTVRRNSGRVNFLDLLGRASVHIRMPDHVCGQREGMKAPSHSRYRKVHLAIIVKFFQYISQ